MHAPDDNQKHTPPQNTDERTLDEIVADFGGMERLHAMSAEMGGLPALEAEVAQGNDGIDALQAWISERVNSCAAERPVLQAELSTVEMLQDLIREASLLSSIAGLAGLRQLIHACIHLRNAAATLAMHIGGHLADDPSKLSRMRDCIKRVIDIGAVAATMRVDQLKPGQHVLQVAKDSVMFERRIWDALVEYAGDPAVAFILYIKAVERGVDMVKSLGLSPSFEAGEDPAEQSTEVDSGE